MTTLSPESSDPMAPAGSFICPAHPTVPIAVSPRRAETATAEALTRAAGRRCPTLPCGNGEGFGRRSIMLGPSQTLAAALRREPGKRGAIRIEKRDLSSKRDIPELAGEGGNRAVSYSRLPTRSADCGRWVELADEIPISARVQERWGPKIALPHPPAGRPASKSLPGKRSGLKLNLSGRPVDCPAIVPVARRASSETWSDFPFPPLDRSPMNYRRLGNSGLQISEIGLGGWLTVGNALGKEQAQAVLEAAFQLGINFLDRKSVV